jgi:solute carrier family 25 iron transporter 28/37
MRCTRPRTPLTHRPPTRTCTHTDTTVIKQRMQLAESHYRGLADCAFRVFKTEGLASFYVSYPITLMIGIPFQAIQLPVYEYLRKTLNPSGDYSPGTHVLAGGVAGGLAAVATNPLDVAKTLLQTRGTSQIVEVQRAAGILDAWRIIHQREGWAGFRRGALARALAQIPATALSWATYEFFKVLITSSSSSSSGGSPSRH